MQADPNIQAPLDSQSYNRYAYVRNNPMSMTDPSGYFFKSLFGFVKKYWRIIAAAVITYFTAGAAAGWAASWGFGAIGTMANSIVAGAMTGFIGGAVATGSLKGAMYGALSGAVFGAIGNQIHGAEGTKNAWSTGEQMFAHGVAGGVMSSLQGGKFGHGFISAGLMKGVGKIETSATLGRTLIQAIAGGTISRLTGGKFGNGAITAAIQYLSNEVSKMVDNGSQFNPIGYKAEGSVSRRMADGKFYWVDKETYGKNIGTEILSKETSTNFADYNETTREEVIAVATVASIGCGFGGLVLASTELGAIALGSGIVATATNPNSTLSDFGWLAVDAATLRAGSLFRYSYFEGLDHAVSSFSWLNQTGNAVAPSNGGK